MFQSNSGEWFFHRLTQIKYARQLILQSFLDPKPGGGGLHAKHRIFRWLRFGNLLIFGSKLSWTRHNRGEGDQMQFITDPKHRTFRWLLFKGIFQSLDPNYLEPGNLFKVITGRGIKCNSLRIQNIEFSDSSNLRESFNLWIQTTLNQEICLRS